MKLTAKRIFSALLLTLWACLLFANNQESIPSNPPFNQLFIPSGKPPFPTIILLHSSSGVNPTDIEWANFLKNNGYVVYIIDSFKPRQIKNRFSIGWNKASEVQLSDVAPAYHYLSKLHFVDTTRMGLMGFSLGGFDTLMVMQDVAKPTHSYENLDIKAAADFYGSCIKMNKNTTFKGTVRIFIGTEDDRAFTKKCIDLVKNNQKLNKKVTIKLYVGALHGFTHSHLPAKMETVDEEGQQYHLGYDKVSASAAEKDLLLFFNQYLKNAP